MFTHAGEGGLRVEGSAIRVWGRGPMEHGQVHPTAVYCVRDSAGVPVFGMCERVNTLSRVKLERAARRAFHAA